MSTASTASVLQRGRPNISWPGATTASFSSGPGLTPSSRPRPRTLRPMRRLCSMNWGDGGHVVAHAQGAIAAMMAAVQRPDLVHSLILIEPLLPSLTAELPATAAYSTPSCGPCRTFPGASPMRTILAEFNTLMAVVDGARHGAPSDGWPPGPGCRRRSTDAPLHIIPGVPTTVITGGWEPLYEEVAEYLGATGCPPHCAPQRAQAPGQLRRGRPD